MKIIFSIVLLFIVSVSFAQPQEVKRIIQKGNEYYKEQKFDAAAAHYAKALEMEPGNKIAKFNMANTLDRQKKQDEAVKTFSAIAYETNEKELKAIAYYNKGAVLSKQKNLEESIVAYKNALRQNPGDNEARENLQKALQELKKKDPKNKKDNQQQQNQDQQQQKQQQSKMSPKEAEQRLKLMQQKEKEIQERQQKEKAKTGGSQSKDW